MAAQICTLCGVNPATTTEHVPAKQLWDPPRPSDLITVPACEHCNQGTQPDDDYFRSTLALVAEQTPSAALESIRPNVTRGFARPQGAGLRAHFEQRMSFRPLGGGVIHQPVLNANSDRLHKVVTKHALGLFYHVVRRPLATAYGVIVLPERWLNRIPAEDRPLWENVMARALDGHRQEIGDGRVFKFALQISDDDPNDFVAVLRYYDNFAYAARSCELAAAPATVQLPPQ
jgi:hypothetical protein